MAAVGGSIESVTLDGREYGVAADAEAQRKLGGWENEIQSNGDGTARMVLRRENLTGGNINIYGKWEGYEPPPMPKKQ